jgi:hypothetical protein
VEWENIGEIDPRRQFNQHSMISFLVARKLAKKVPFKILVKLAPDSSLSKECNNTFKLTQNVFSEILKSFCTLFVAFCCFSIFLQVKFQGFHVVVEPQRRHGEQDVFTVDGFPFFGLDLTRNYEPSGTANMPSKYIISFRRLSSLNMNKVSLGTFNGKVMS